VRLNSPNWTKLTPGFFCKTNCPKLFVNSAPHDPPSALPFCFAATSLRAAETAVFTLKTMTAQMKYDTERTARPAPSR
jgi:hypothetical protein